MLIKTRCGGRGATLQAVPGEIMGSRRLTISNRKFLRKFTPGYSRPGDLLKKLRPTVPVQTTVRQVHPDQQGQQPRTVTVTTPPPDLPQHEQAGQPDWHVPYQVPIPVPSEPPQMPQQAPNQQPEQPLLQLMYPATNPVRRSARANKGTTSRFADYDVSSLSEGEQCYD